MSEDNQLITKEKKLLIMSLLAAPIFAIVNPVSFFLGYINCFEETDMPSVYVPNFKTYFTIAMTVFIVITLLKYPLFMLKRRFAKKKQSITLFYLFHSASQLPYLILLGIFYNYWEPRDLNEIAFGFFLWYFVVSVVTWIISFSIFNLLTYTYPQEEELSSE